MAGKFVISKTKNGEYTFSLKAGNGEIILVASESYASIDGCKNGVESVRSNAGAHVEDQTKDESRSHPKYELYQDKAGEYRFRLKARNGQNIGKSEGYKAKAGALNGIESISKNAPDAAVIEEE